MTASALISILLTPLAGGALASLLIGRKTDQPCGLLLHSVNSNPLPSMSSLHQNTFKEFLNCLNAAKIPAATLFESRLNAGKKVILTFDDGLLDYYTHAFPLLEEKKMKSTVFMVAGFMGGKSSWDVMGRADHLTKPMLREISDSGHEIGSHTLTHANLVWLDDMDLKRELFDSKKILEDITGKEVKSISFPFGFWNDRVWEMAKEAGYERGTVYRHHNRTKEGLLPVFGVYRFDRASDIFARIFPNSGISTSRALAVIMSQFSKGSPIWKFRKEYTHFP